MKINTVFFQSIIFFFNISNIYTHMRMPMIINWSIFIHRLA